MKIRGQRECKDCGAQWSYYETGSIACPECESLHSVGRNDRQLHTASPATLDLTDVKQDLESEPIETVARRGAQAAATFVRKHGFIRGGELEPLTEQFVTATELRHAGLELSRSLRISDSEEQYLLAILAGAENGERPPADAVPDSMEAVRGLASTSAVEDYQRDLRRYLAEHPDENARQILGRVADHRTRIEALDGDVAPETADTLIGAVRAVGQYLIDEGTTLEAARRCLDELDTIPV